MHQIWTQLIRVRSARQLILVATLFALTAFGFGQETTGGIKGFVKDKSGAAIAKAQVEVSSTALITPRKGDTDSAGYFYFQKLPPGEYTCQVTVLDPTGQKAVFWQAPVMLIP